MGRSGHTLPPSLRVTTLIRCFVGDINAETPIGPVNSSKGKSRLILSLQLVIGTIPLLPVYQGGVRAYVAVIVVLGISGIEVSEPG